MNDFNFKNDKEKTNPEHHAFNAEHKVKETETESKLPTENTEIQNELNEDESFPWLFAIISIFLAGIVAIIIYLAVAPSKAGDDSNTTYEDGQVIEEVALPENADQINLIAGKYYPPYKLKNIYEGKGWTGEQKLLNSKNEVLIEDMSIIFPELKDEHYYLNILGQPQGADFIVLDIRNEDKNGYLYKFNIETLEKSSLSANAVYSNKNSKNYLSDNHRQMIMIPSSEVNGLEQKLYLIDLLNGSYKTILEIDGNKSFNGGWEYYADFIQGEWLSPTEFSIAIFDQSKKEEKPENAPFPYLPSSEVAEKIFIENQIIVIE